MIVLAKTFAGDYKSSYPPTLKQKYINILYRTVQYPMTW